MDQPFVCRKCGKAYPESIFEDGVCVLCTGLHVSTPAVPVEGPVVFRSWVYRGIDRIFEEEV